MFALGTLLLAIAAATLPVVVKALVVEPPFQSAKGLFACVFCVAAGISFIRRARRSQSEQNPVRETEEPTGKSGGMWGLGVVLVALSTLLLPLATVEYVRSFSAAGAQGMLGCGLCLAAGVSLIRRARKAEDRLRMEQAEKHRRNPSLNLPP